MRFHASTLLALPLLLGISACSGGTDTVPGTGSSGSANGKKSEASNNEPEGQPSATEPSRTSSPDKPGVPEPDDETPGNDPNDPNVPPAASGVDGVIEVPQAVATSAAADYVLSQSKKTKRIDIVTTNLTCPAALSSALAPYVYVELKNTGAKRALTSVWTSSSGGGPANTANALAVYPGPTPPATDAARQNCLGTVSYSCSGGPCVGWPGLSSSSGDAVEVPANGSVLVFVQGEVAKTGSFKLNVRTDFLQ